MTVLKEDEFFTLSLDADDEGVVLFPNTTIINIMDNDCKFDKLDHLTLKITLTFPHIMFSFLI